MCDPHRPCERQPTQEVSPRPTVSPWGTHGDLLSQSPCAKSCRRECRGVGEGCQSSRQGSYTCSRNTIGFTPHRGKGSRDTGGELSSTARNP
jgi:hypothetical protein